MAENQEKKNEEIREFGQIQMKNKISLLTIIGEIEGHDCLPATTKTTKYEHVLPNWQSWKITRIQKGCCCF